MGTTERWLPEGREEAGGAIASGPHICGNGRKAVLVVSMH